MLGFFRDLILSFWKWLSGLPIAVFFGIPGIITTVYVVRNFHYNKRKDKLQQEKSAEIQEKEHREKQQKLLSEYFEEIHQLIENGQLPDTKKNIARFKTLNTLNQLDGVLKGHLLLFLYGQKLINRGDAKISLKEAFLDKLVLHEDNLEDICLKGVSINEAKLFSSNLNRADLSEAYLNGTVLIDTTLRGAMLNDAKLYGVKFAGADMREAQLCNAQLVDAHLKKADLTGANLKKANLWLADLSNAKLVRADLTDVNLVDAILKDADYTDGQLEKAILCRTVLKDDEICDRDCEELRKAGLIWFNY